MSKKPKKNPKAQTELTDEELDGVAGGVHHHQHPLVIGGVKMHMGQVTRIKPQPGEWTEKSAVDSSLSHHNSNNSPI